MKTLFDVSVLYAAQRAEHERHAESLALFAYLEPGSGYMAAHAGAEFFALATSLPKSRPMPPEHAMMCLRAMENLLQTVTLDEADYARAIARAASCGLPGSAVYDALHLEAAYKVGADMLCTWNADRLQALNNSASLTILTPMHWPADA